MLDPDLLGIAAAVLVGTAVMALGFWLHVDGFAIAYRSGLAFVVTYAAVFLLVRFVLHTALSEMVAERKRAEEARAAVSLASEGEEQ